MSENNDLKQDVVRERILLFIQFVKANKNTAIQVSISILVIIMGFLYYNESKQQTEYNAKIMLGKAQNSYIDSRIEDAIDGFNNIVNDYPNTSASNIAKLYLVNDYVNNDMSLDALELLNDLSTSLENDILRTSVLNMMGNIYIDMNEFEKASNAFKDASLTNSLSPFTDEALLNLAKTYKLMQEYEKSIKILQELITNENIKYNLKNEAEQLEGELKYLISNKTN